MSHTPDAAMQGASLVSRPGVVRLGKALAMATLACFALLGTALVLWMNFGDIRGDTIHSEFSVFWAAGQLALAGDWAAAFDLERLTEARALDPSMEAGSLLWSYPPLFHLIVAPFGALPFSAAWILFNALLLACFALALRAAAGRVPGVWAFAIAAPAVSICMGLGQNALLTTAILVGIWECLRHRAHAAAGLLAAMLTIKPQLCLLVPFVFLALGAWRAILFGALGVVVIVLVTLVVPGPDYWQIFLQASSETMGWIRNGVFQETLMVTWYATLTVAGLGRDVALAAQTGVTLLVLSVVIAVMRQPVSDDLKGAVLLLGVPLAIPYAFHYELTLAIPAAAYLIRAGLAEGAGRFLPIALWLAPVPGLMMLGGPNFFFAAPLLTLAFAVAARAAFARRETALA